WSGASVPRGAGDQAGYHATARRAVLLSPSLPRGWDTSARRATALFQCDAIAALTEGSPPVPLIERRHRVRHLVKRLLHRLIRGSGADAHDASAQSGAALSRRQRMARVSERAILGAAITGALVFAERR